MRKTVNYGYMADIRLSNRMNSIIDMVSERSVCDIGCDHAFIAIELIRRGICDRVIATDVRKGPLLIAENNIRKHGLLDYISVRLSDGFDTLAEHEAECAVIAGMGGELITNILARGDRHLKNGISLVLQPQSEIHLVRRYLHNNGYGIVRESMIFEGGKYYTVMRAVPKSEAEPYTDCELMYGRFLIESKDPLLMSYLRDRHAKNSDIINGLLKGNTDKAKLRIKELQGEQLIIEKCLFDMQGRNERQK